ncbi:MAG TPA: SDR family NAD(P)-dependent oxidoreductase, partial [Pyrinomonadaceae bacterium]|nr:SDR family NAD(P)-dependent oxidoreductase [Pyrinomonadaceae bacterium]
GRELAARFPEFRASLVECDELLAQRTQEWRLLEELERGPEESRLDGEEMDLTQCALFALQVSLARLWSSFGVRPAAVVGHSMGEVAAAVAAGVLSLAEGVEVIYERSRLLRRASGRGAMAAVELGEEEAEAEVKGLGPQTALVNVAAVNGKHASVVSGEREAVQWLMRELEAKGVMTREVRTSGVAAHSAQVADLGEELERVLGGIRGRASEVRLVSTVSGRAIAGEEVDASYWGRNLREQVRFRAAMQELAHSGDAVYVEMSAHPVLGLWIREALEEANKPATVIAVLRRERSDAEVTLTGLAELYAAGGVSINWEAVWRGRVARYVTLPAYPWQRRRFWIEPPTSQSQTQILTEADLENDPQRNRLVEGLIQKWGREGVLAVNRRYLAPFIFVSRTQQSLFYFNLKNRSIVGLMYVGPDDQYGPLVKELREYCQSKRLQLNLIATESGTPALRELGFSTTPCGALQSITDLKNFTLDGNRMRRLRYLVQRYEPGGKIKEYKAGSDPNVDEDICNLIDNWIETKKKRVPFSATLKDDIRSGRLDPRLRLFLTYSDERLDSAVVISPAVAANGYLLDLEFYREDGAHGCLEFTLVEIIRTLAGEGREYLSLGGSFGTQLNPHPNADAQVEQLFATLHDEQILNGDGNFQFKSKFRPETSQLYLCLPKDSEHVAWADVLTTLAGDGASGEEVKQLSLRLKSEAPETTHRRSNRSLHPLLGEKLHLALDEEVFQSYQSIASLSFLGDHAVGGIVVMPGTAYIEMGLAAAQHALGPGAHSIVDLSIQQVMAFPEPNTETTVQLTLKREDGGASFRILSEGDSGQWLLHATGTIRSEATAPVDVSVEAIRSRCTEEITGDAFYQLLRRNGLEYGPSFQGVKHVWRRDREAVGRVQLPESQSAELKNYRIHPALLDACFQIFEATIDTGGETEDAIYLLRGAEQITVHGELPKRIWAHAVLRDSDNSDLYAGDLMLYGESERPVAQVKGIYAKRTTRSSLVRNTQKHLSDWLYEIRWQLSTAEEHDAAGMQPRAWVIFCDDGELGRNLKAKLHSHGQPCLLVHPGKDYDATRTGDINIDHTNPEHFSRVLNEAVLASPGLPLGVVFSWTIDTDQTPDMQRLDQSIELGCRSVLNLARAAIDTGARLWLVTRGAQSTGTETVAPAQSALWGMGRVIAAEHPETFGGLIDLEPGAKPSADALFREIVRPAGGEDQIVYRAGQRHVARLVRSTIAKNDPLRFKDSATYLITGGLGGLGLDCAGWMIDHGARYIALASRRSTSDELQTKISHWEKQGATVRIFQTDVTCEDEVKNLISGIEQSMPPLKGIIHAAGLIEDGMAHKQTWEQFQRVLEPKVRGAYALHLHTRHLSLDFFTLFSSAASMFGSVGQINHAAANAFLDGLAHHRKAHGLPALSINWGAWSEIGEAAKQNVPERLAPKGIDSIEPEHGWRVFEMIFNHPAAQVGVVPIDWERWQRRYTGKVPPMMAELMQESKPARSNQRRRDLIEAFFSVEPDKQQEKLEEYLIHEAARVLRMEPASLDPQQPLSTFGLDSIMTVELRDRIDAEWQVRVPLVEFFREPTIARLSSIMLEQLRSLNPALGSSPADPAELLNRLDQMSETEMDKLLDVLLAEQDAAQSETAVASV